MVPVLHQPLNKAGPRENVTQEGSKREGRIAKNLRPEPLISYFGKVKHKKVKKTFTENRLCNADCFNCFPFKEFNFDEREGERRKGARVNAVKHKKNFRSLMDVILFKNH